jgi:hypothetical protein
VRSSTTAPFLQLDPIVPIGARAVTDIDDNREAHQAGERHLLGRLVGGREMGRRVKVGAAVLSSGEIVGLVVPAPGCLPAKDAVQAKGGGRGPVDRLGGEIMAEVDPPPSCKRIMGDAAPGASGEQQGEQPQLTH